MNVGDPVECVHTVEWQNQHREMDTRKARKLGISTFMGNAAAYLHLDEAYVIESFTETGGVRLRGFAATVSLNDLRPSEKRVCR